jgi:hypothetical protein
VPEEHNIVGTGSKDFASGPLGAKVNDTFQFPHLDSWTHEFWLWKKQYHVLDACSQHTQLPVEPWPSLARYHHVGGAVTEIFKGSSIILPSQPI